ncbi:helix-turn-helix transcriptional regulator [Streptomyces sp. NPDC000658]|uniref:helix-turn-helix domain-containing protein n=1 Tax=Streptomyces sp. NPDC000658 TaxID=3154266 RepID=UPI0033293B46
MSAGVRLAGNLIESRIEMGKSQRGLALICGMDFTTISRIEAAERVPSALHLTKMLNAFTNEGGLILDPQKWEQIIHEGTQCKATFHPDGRVTVAAPSTDALPHGRNASSNYSSVAGRLKPRGVHSKTDLCEAMDQMWRSALFPSARQMETVLEVYTQRIRRLGPFLPTVPFLGRTTLNSMRRGVQQDPPVFPKKVSNFRSFVVACGLEDQLEPWTQAWHRADETPDEG